MSDLVQTTRCMIIQNRINLISKQELIQWADSMILNMPEPPNFILDLSMGVNPVIPEEIDTVLNPINSNDCSNLLEALQKNIGENELDMNQIESVCYQLALIAEGSLSEKLHWVSDEIHLCNEGCKDLDTALPEIKSVLNEITTKNT